MDTAIARKHLEEIQAELERSIAVLRGEAEQDERVSDYPQDPADAGANLSESERTQAVLHVARTQHSEVLEALRRVEIGTYGTCVACGGGVPRHPHPRRVQLIQVRQDIVLEAFAALLECLWDRTHLLRDCWLRATAWPPSALPIVSAGGYNVWPAELARHHHRGAIHDRGVITLRAAN